MCLSKLNTVIYLYVFQILDKYVCVPLRFDVLSKDLNPSILPVAMSK